MTNRTYSGLPKPAGRSGHFHETRRHQLQARGIKTGHLANQVNPTNPIQSAPPAAKDLGITEKEFQAYEDVRNSGVTNMFAVNVVEQYSGLPREKIMTIMKNYEELMKKYPKVRESPEDKEKRLKLEMVGKGGVKYFDSSEKPDYETMTIWEGIDFKDEDIPKMNEMFKENGFHPPQIVALVKTLPDVENGEVIEGTGGRSDLFFKVHNADIGKFAVWRFQYGMRWWEDVFFNHQEGIYPQEIRTKYPDPVPRAERIEEGD